MKRTLWTAAIAAAALVAGPAMAQVDATDVEGRRMVESTEKVGNYDVAAQAGLGSFVGGGQLGSSTGIGPTWGVKLSGPLARAFGWELGYEGSRTPVDIDNVADGNSALWRNGLSAMGKIYSPMSDQSSVRPFAGAGVGASYVNVGDGAEGSFNNDFLTEVPLGLGLEYAPEGSGLTAGVRGTYRVLFGEEMSEPLGETGGAGMLGASLNIGGSF